LSSIQTSDLTIEPDEEGIYWRVETAQVSARINIRRGLALQSLCFPKADPTQWLGSLPQGYYSGIELAADYYSGNTVVELPQLRKRLTDLEWAQAQVLDEADSVTLIAVLDCSKMVIRKKILISKVKPEIHVHIELVDFPRPIGTVRAPIFSLLPEAFGNDIQLLCTNGGRAHERFKLSEDFDHSSAVSSLVSSNGALGATTGELRFVNNRGVGLTFQWNPAVCALVPMVQHISKDDHRFVRLIFSTCELDDTSTAGGRLLPISVAVKYFTARDCTDSNL
jgi:hypothetical protein